MRLAQAAPLYLAPIAAFVFLVTGCRTRRPTAGVAAEAGVQADAAASNATTTSAVATVGLPRVPTLDANEGKNAAGAYRAFIQKFCGGTATPVPTLDAWARPGATRDHLCLVPDEMPKPVASGAFLAASTTEVLLEVQGGIRRPVGGRALAVMRREGGTYRLVKHLFSGSDFKARARFITPSGRDALILCDSGGIQGVYPGTCGFFGSGTFSEGAAKYGERVVDTHNEIGTVFATLCRPNVSVQVEDVHADKTVSFDVVVEHYTQAPALGEEGGFYCMGQHTTTDKKRFTIEYRFDGMHFERTKPLPNEIVEALAEAEQSD